MLSNAYFVAKFRFDTAENKPAKNLQNFAKLILQKIANFAQAAAENPPRAEGGSRRGAAVEPSARREARLLS